MGAKKGTIKKIKLFPNNLIADELNFWDILTLYGEKS